MKHPVNPPNPAMPLFRPKLLLDTARIGARHYRRDRDLRGAIPGLDSRRLALSGGHLLARLTDAEWSCEMLRREGSPAYRPGHHVQVLSALIAEAGRGQGCESSPTPPRTQRQRGRPQTKASGSESLRAAM